jgi:hypothetical protein
MATSITAGPAGEYTELRMVVSTALAVEVERTVARLLESGGQGYYNPPYPPTYGPRDPWKLPEWEPSTDTRAAAWALEDLNGPQRRVVDALLARPHGEWIDRSQLLVEAGYADGPTATWVFREINSRCRAAGRRPYWLRRKGSGGQHEVTVSSEAVRALFEGARASTG